MFHVPFALGLPGFAETIVIFVVMLLVFGRDLPAVARKIGRFIAEIRREIDSFRDGMLREEPPQEGKIVAEKTADPTTDSANSAENAANEPSGTVPDAATHMIPDADGISDSETAADPFPTANPPE